MGTNTIFLCTAIGALVGSMIGILLMNRKVRLPISGADLTALRTKVQAAEAALAASNTTVEGLRKQLAERDQAIQANAEDLKQKQGLLERAAQQAEKDKLQRSVDDQMSQELSSRNAALVKERNDFETRLEEESRASAEKSTHLANIEEQLANTKRQVLELTGRVDGLIAEGAALSRFREQESRHRVSLEAHLTREQEHGQQLAKQVAELESERSRMEVELRDERESATRGMELLAMAQANLSKAAKPVNGEIRNGDIRHLTVEEVSEQAEVVRTATSVD